MGTNPSHPLAPRRVNVGTRRNEDAVTLRERTARQSLFVLLLAIFAFFAGNSYSQDLSTLETTIRTGNTEQKRDALFQIRNLRSEIASRIALPSLKDAEPIVRATAASSVVFLPKPEAVAVLTPLLGDKDPFVRKEAAYALGTVESPDSAAPLIDILGREKDLEVRAAAAAGLGSTGNPTAITPLTKILNDRPVEETEFLRRSAARSVGQIAQSLRAGDTRIVTPQGFVPEKLKDPQIRPSSSTPDFTGAIKALENVLRNSNEADDPRREAAFALGAIASPEAIAVLETSRNSPDPYLAGIAREALAKIANANPVN